MGAPDGRGGLRRTPRRSSLPAAGERDDGARPRASRARARDARRGRRGAAAPRRSTRRPRAGPRARGARRARAGDGAAAGRAIAEAAGSCSPARPRAIRATPRSRPIWGSRSASAAGAPRRRRSCAAPIDKDPRRYYAYVNLADLLAERSRALGAARRDRRLSREGARRAEGRPQGALQPAAAASRASSAPSGAPPRRARGCSRSWRPDAAAALARAAQARARPARRDRARRARARAGGLARARAEAASWPRAEVERALDAGARRRPTRRASGASAERHGALPARARAGGAGRVDEAMRDLEIAVNLAPSNAEAWRALGRLLAAHGGALELDRADEALRQALTLEPAWSDLRELRAQIARRRAVVARARRRRERRRPRSTRARSLPTGRGVDRRRRSDRHGARSRRTGAGRLARLRGRGGVALRARRARCRRRPSTRSTTTARGCGRWPTACASWARAARPQDRGREAAPRPTATRWSARGSIAPSSWTCRRRGSRGRRPARRRAIATGALADLVAYVAREPDPEHLAEARALRAGLAEADRRSARRNDDARLAPQLLARIRLIEDRPDAALRALGGTCTPGAAAGPPAWRSAWSTSTPIAGPRPRGCYELAGAGRRPRRAGPAGAPRRPPARRASCAPADRALLERGGRRTDVAAACWALARLDGCGRHAQDGAGAGPHARRRWPCPRRRRDAAGRPTAGSRPPRRASEAPQSCAPPRSARRVRRRRLRRRGRRWRCRARRCWLADAAGAAGPSRRRCAGAPRSSPRSARAVAELRHDVLKHRAGVLGAVADPQVPRATRSRRALTEPRPTSVVVAGDLRPAGAGGAGRGRRRCGRSAREPVFGALVRDLARAERCWPRARRRGGRDELAARSIAACAARTPTRSTRCCRWARAPASTPATLSRWIAARRGGRRAARAAAGPRPACRWPIWISTFPSSATRWRPIFANLLRNAAGRRRRPARGARHRPRRSRARRDRTPVGHACWSATRRPPR